MTSSAAMAALAHVEPAPRPERLSWVSIRTAPEMRPIYDPTDSEVILGEIATVDPDLQVTDIMLTVLRAVCDETGASRCRAQGCVGGFRGSPGPVGFTASDSADVRAEWTPLTMVQRGREAIAVCDNCAPASLYQMGEG